MTAAYRTVLHRVYRASRRHALGRASTLRARGGAPMDVLVEDVSATGCRLSGVRDLGLHEAVLIGLAGLGARPARVVWAQDGQAGCHFDVPLSAAELERAQEAGVVVRSLFPLTMSPGKPTDMNLAGEPGAPTPRARLIVICLAAMASWLILGAVALVLWRLLR